MSVDMGVCPGVCPDKMSGHNISVRCPVAVDGVRPSVRDSIHDGVRDGASDDLCELAAMTPSGPHSRQAIHH